MLIDFNQKYETPVVANAFNAWIDIHAPIDLVFRFLTEGNKLGRWWATRCTAEPRPGGSVQYYWSGDREMTGDAFYRRFEPPNLLMVEWTHQNGEPIRGDGKDPRGMLWPPLNIYELVLISGQTVRLHLHDLGINSLPAYEEMRTATQEGWALCLSRLKKAVEQYHRKQQANKKKKSPTKTPQG